MNFNHDFFPKLAIPSRKLARAGSIFLASLLMAANVFAAESVTTTPRGIYTVKIAGTSQPSKPARTYLGIQLLPTPRYMGLASNVNGNQLSLQGVFTEHAALADAERKCYVQVLTGSGRGFVTDITSFGSSDLGCAEDLTPWISPGTKVRIRAHPLLMDLFGADNRFALGAGADADSADNLVLWDPDTQQERVFYFHSIRNRWEEKNIEADASHTTFRFPYGFYIVRRSPGTIRISLSGEIGSDAILLPVRTAANVFSLPVNLSASLDQLVRAEGPFSVTSGPNAKRSDLLIFEEPTSGTQRGPFYHLSKANTSGWRQVGVNGSSAPIQPLDFLSTLILRRPGDPGRVLVEGSLEPPAIPRQALPADPEPGELPLDGQLSTTELRIPPTLPPDISLTVESSTDLVSWTSVSSVSPVNGSVTFSLPAGQSRSFYRVKVTF